MLLVQDRETTECVVVEILEGDRNRDVLLEHDKTRGHVLLTGIVQPAAFKRLDDLVHRDHAEETLALQDRKTGDLVVAHQLLRLAERVLARQGDDVARPHDVLHVKPLKELHDDQRRILRHAVVRHDLIIAAVFATAQDLGLIVAHSPFPSASRAR